MSTYVCELCGEPVSDEFGDVNGSIVCPKCLGWYGTDPAPEVSQGEAEEQLLLNDRSKALGLYADLMDDDEREEWIENGMEVSDEELRATLGGAGELSEEEDW